MCPIEGVSDIKRLPRRGKIRLGIKKEGQHGPYPQAVDYFVCPDEVKAIHGDTPKELPIMFPHDNWDLVAPQWYKCYSYTQGLTCKGDGKSCDRKVDTKTGDFANKDTKKWVMGKGDCNPNNCPMLVDKQCRKVMSLLFILYEVPGLGVYQLDTTSFYSITNINSMIAPDGYLRRYTRGRIAYIPLVLYIGPQVVTPMGEGRKTVQTLHLDAKVKLVDIIQISRQGPRQVLLPTLKEEEPPDDLYPDEVLKSAEEKPAQEPSANVSATQQQGVGEVPSSDAATAAPEPPASPPKSTAEQASKRAKTSTAAQETSIDLVWLNDIMRRIKWTEDTAKTWISSNIKNVDIQGKLSEVLARLTKDQTEKFCRELQDRAAKVQPELFT